MAVLTSQTWYGKAENASNKASFLKQPHQMTGREVTKACSPSTFPKPFLKNSLANQERNKTTHTHMGYMIQDLIWTPFFLIILFCVEKWGGGGGGGGSHPPPFPLILSSQVQAARNHCLHSLWPLSAWYRFIAHWPSAIIYIVIAGGNPPCELSVSAKNSVWMH